MTIGLLVRCVDLNECDRELWMAAFDVAEARGANLVLVGARSSFVPDTTDVTSSTLYAVLCNNVKIGKNCRVTYGASVIAEGGEIAI